MVHETQVEQFLTAYDKAVRELYPNGPRYMLHRAWVQITNQKADENSIEQSSVNMKQLEGHYFSVTWLGHDTMLIKAGKLWILTDPVFSLYASPTAPLGPKRLVQLPLDMKDLPHIDIVLISHDHYDHLDLQTVRELAKQKNGSPLFLTGLGLKSWFKSNVADATVEELNWWDEKNWVMQSLYLYQHNIPVVEHLQIRTKHYGEAG